MRARAALILLSAGLIGAAMSFGANVYQAVVEVPNWTAQLPQAVHDFRACVRHSHPGYYFQVLVPATVLCLAGGAIAGWNRPRARNRWAIVALAGVLAAELFTVAYFFPRNAVLFFDPLDRSTAQALASAAIEWRNAHFLRMAMLAAGVLGALRALLQGPAPRQE